MLQKRQEYKEKTKGALIFNDFPVEKKSKGRGKIRDREYVSDSDSSGVPGSPSAESKPPKTKRRKRFLF